MQFSAFGLLRRTRRMFGVGKFITVFWTVGGGGLKVGLDIVGVGFLEEGDWKMRTGQGVFESL